MNTKTSPITFADSLNMSTSFSFNRNHALNYSKVKFDTVTNT